MSETGFITAGAVTQNYLETHTLEDGRFDTKVTYTGFHTLDIELAGFYPSDLVILGGVPAAGKSDFILNVARNTAVRFNNQVVFFSLQNSRNRIGERLLSIESGVDSSRMRIGRIVEDEIKNMRYATTTLGASPFYVNDEPHLNVSEIREKTLSSVEGKNIGLVIIDSMQDIAKPTRLKNERIPSLPESLKSLAEEIKAPVLVVGGLTREIERRTDPTPRLSDLAGGHLVAEMADVVLFLLRDFYSSIEWRRKEIIDVIISKNRNGPTNKVPLAYRVENGRFDNDSRERIGGATSL